MRRPARAFGFVGLIRLSWCTIMLMAAAPVFAATQAEPSVWHGIAKVVGGMIFELPRTVIEATSEGPPVVGTMVGLLAGTARAFQTTVGGLVEISTAFDPWGSKRR